MSAQRQVWQDRAKGIGIVLVVFGHAMRGLTGAHIAPDTPAIQAVDYTLYLFHMPLFFLLAGLNVERSARKGAQSFLRDKLHTIVWPYLLWSIAQGLVLVRLSGAVNIPLTYGDLARILWAPISQFWFLYALMVCHLAYLAFRGRKAILLPLAAIGFAASPLAPFLPAKILFNFTFYALGLLVAPQIADWLARLSSPRVLAFVCAGFGALVVAGLQTGIAFDNPLSLPAALAGIALTLLVSSLLHGRVGQVAEIVGRMSMTIYILHLFAAGGARVVMQKLGVPADVVVYAVATTFVGIAVPMASHVIFERLGLLVWLGLAAPKRSGGVALSAR
ncbi:MAG: acyltransferase family protein [Rhodoblastus sp.]